MRKRQAILRSRRGWGLTAGAVLTAMVTTTPGVAGAATPTGSWRVTERASVSSKRQQGNGSSQGYATLAANGNLVVFRSDATNLVPGDTNGASDVFVRDVAAGTTERVSVSSTGGQANGNSALQAISPDGRFVVFTSQATNLVPGDTNGVTDVFLRDRRKGTTERVSVSSTGGQANSDSASFPVGVSRDGRYVAFYSDATNLVPGDTNGLLDVFVRDRTRGTTERVSVSSTGGQANGISWFPYMSADGRYVAFSSNATNLVPGDTNAKFDVFVHDLKTGRTLRASVSSTGKQGDGDSSVSGISANGRYVLFGSNATNLVPGDTNAKADAFVRDLQAGTTERVSVSNTGRQANGDSTSLGISDDGRYVAVSSDATNLVPGDTNNKTDAFVRDRRTGKTERVQASSGEQPNGLSYPTTISPDGKVLVMESEASNLVRGDTNKTWDVFLARRS